MAVLRGRGFGIEIAFAGRDFDDVADELQGKLDEQPGFYAGSAATAVLGDTTLSGQQLNGLLELLRGHGIALKAISGGPHLKPLAEASGLRYVQMPIQPALSDAARSLNADFAGARAEIAARRARGQASVRRVDFGGGQRTDAGGVPAPSTLLHGATLRGGQSIHHLGNIVLIGDANPGAELVATGDIVIFGALRGTAHAGAQGDTDARIYAIEFDARQLRIASAIATDAGLAQTAAKGPQIALLQSGRIAIVPYDRVQWLRKENVH